MALDHKIDRDFCRRFDPSSKQTDCSVSGLSLC